MGPAGAALGTATLKGVGTVLVDAQGHTLYTFAPDNASKITCLHACAAVWPPDELPAGSKPAISGAVNPALVSTALDPEGGTVVTYAGWPLYRYIADSSAGSAAGQALTLSGGTWYVITPAGKPVH